MRVENIGPILVDPARTEKSDRGSTAPARISHSENKEGIQAQAPFQKDLRSADEIRQDIKAINDQLKSMNRSIRFNVDDSTQDIVVKVVDKDTGEVVIQIPPEDILRLRKRLNEMAGLLVEKQA